MEKRLKSNNEKGVLKNKKGLSAIVATVLLVLLTIAAVGVLMGFVIPFVKKQLQEGSECVNYEDYFFFEKEFGYNCYTLDAGKRYYGFSIGAVNSNEDIEEDIAGFRLALGKSGEYISVDIFDGEATETGEGKVRMHDASLTELQIPNGGEVRTYIYESRREIEIANVYPILKSGRNCEAYSDLIRLNNRQCEKSLFGG